MSGKDWVELLKFPLTIFVGIVTIVLASIVLGVKPEYFQLGDMKVQLRSEITRELVVSNLDLESIVKEQVLLEIEKLNLPQISNLRVDDDSLVNDVVSDPLAKFARIKTDNGEENVFVNTRGYIWIGNYKPETNKYSSITLRKINNIEDVEVDEVYTVTGNMVIREGNPVNNVKYYKGERKVGLAVKESKVRILSAPTYKKLSRYYQYWVEVEVVK